MDYTKLITELLPGITPRDKYNYLIKLIEGEQRKELKTISDRAKQFQEDIN